MQCKWNVCNSTCPLAWRQRHFVCLLACFCRLVSERITCSSAMSACEKGMQWEHALVLFSELARSNLQLGFALSEVRFACDEARN